MAYQATDSNQLSAADIVRAARQRLTRSQGACSTGNPELLKAAIDGLLEEIHATTQVRAKIQQELGFSEQPSA